MKLTYDKLSINSVRSKDGNGFLHVSVSPLTKEQVAGYLGREIPFYNELGLDADRIYKVYRPARELQKAAESFNGLPILLRHSEDSADKPQKELRVGTTGTNAAFDGQYLTNALSFHDAEAIRLIESGLQRELSAGYYYTPVVESGAFKGEAYDVRMADIRGNHIALVREGRAGGDVLVRDEKNREVKMRVKQRVLDAMKLLRGKAAADGETEKEAAADAELRQELLLLVPEEDREKAAILLDALTGAQSAEAEPSEDGDADADELVKLVESRFRDKELAAQDVRPLVGAVNTAAFDSAEGIYRYAMQKAGIETGGVPHGAHGHVVRAYLRAKSPAASLSAQGSLPDGLIKAGIDISRFQK